VQPYQFGEGNEEGLQSGAFWFYYRLGFLPEVPALRKLAHQEAEKRRTSPTYRTALSTLKKLTGSKLVLNLGAIPRDHDVSNIGLALADTIGRRFGGEIARAEAAGMRVVDKILSRKGRSRASIFEQDSLRRMTVFLGCASDIKHWRRQEREDLIHLFIKKGGLLERDYIRAVQRHHRFCELMEKLDQEGKETAR
jgi:hypothetical protein